MMVKEAKEWTLFSCDDFFVINKPEGIAVPYKDDDEITVYSIYSQLSTQKKWTLKPKYNHSEIGILFSGCDL